ncbi:MAG: helix-turn-helix domain-containing protein [Candidatus Ventricola sp.]
MPTSSEAELRRQLEEPLSCEYRSYPPVENSLLVTMLDTPYYPPYMPDSLHVHNCLEIGICLAGSGQVFLHDRGWRFSAGSVIVAPRGVYHNQQNEGEPLTHWRYLVISDDYIQRSTPDRFRGEILALMDDIRETGLFLESSADSALDSIVKLMYDLNRQGDADAERQIELCVYLLLLEIARQRSRTPLLTPGEPVDRHQRQPIEPALAYICDHYKEDIRVSTLARTCSMSESYFRKQFARIMGMSPMEHVNRYRVHRAMNLLRTTSDSIQNIAVRAGYASIAAFNRNFKQYAGQNPSDWRRSRLNK